MNIKSSNTYPIVKELFGLKSQSMPQINYQLIDEKICEKRFSFHSNSFPLIKEKQKIISNSLELVIIKSQSEDNMNPLTPPLTPPFTKTIVSIRRKRFIKP